jgi:hypothetical protein
VTDIRLLVSGDRKPFPQIAGSGGLQMKLLLAACAASALLAAASTASATNLLVNGDFEASSSDVTTPPGWTNIGHEDGVIPYSAFVTPPYDGLFFYDIGGFGSPLPAPGDGIEQTVTTTPGAHYTLTFGLTHEDGSGPEIADVMIGSQLTQYPLGIDGDGPLKSPFVTHQISYVAAGATTTIAFTVDPASAFLGNNDPMIDKVIFSPVVAGGVPEPATWATVLLGLGGMGAVLRRRRASGAA